VVSNENKNKLFVEEYKFDELMNDFVKKPTIKRDIILAYYFQNLSRQAVLFGAGVIDLFFKEVEKAKKDNTLLKAPISKEQQLASGDFIFSIFGEFSRIQDKSSALADFLKQVLGLNSDSNKIAINNSPMPLNNNITPLPSLINLPQASQTLIPIQTPVFSKTPQPNLMPMQSLTPIPTSISTNIPTLTPTPSQSLIPTPTVLAESTGNNQDNNSNGSPVQLTPTPNPFETSTPIPSETPMPSETPTPTPSETPVPTPIPTPTPTPTPTLIPDYEAPLTPEIISHTNNQFLTSSQDVNIDKAGLQINLQGLVFKSINPNVFEVNAKVFIEIAMYSTSTPATSTLMNFETQTDINGLFSTEISLFEGDNLLTVFAKDTAGNQSSSTEIILKVDAKAPIPNLLFPNFKPGDTSDIYMSWSADDSDIDTYDLRYKYGPDGNIVIFKDKTKTTKAYFTAYNIYPGIYIFQIRARDKNGNVSAWYDYPLYIGSSPVVINEIAWMGTEHSANDEWIELFNRTDKPIDLSGWILKSADNNPYIEFSDPEAKKLTTIIQPKSYYVIAIHENIFSNYTPHWQKNLAGGLDNGGDALTLIDNKGRIIDFVGSWYAGSNQPKATMERVAPIYSYSYNSKNWRTAVSDSNVLDKNKNPIKGSPGSINTVTNPIQLLYQSYIPKTTEITTDRIFKKEYSPYFIYMNSGEKLNIQSGARLTIEAGTLVFITCSLSMCIEVNGELNIEGNEDDPVIITSSEDPDYGGIGNATSTSYFSKIEFKSSSKGKINNAIFKYGGDYYNDFNGLIHTDTSDLEIKNSKFIKNKSAGVYVHNSSPIISDSLFDSNQNGILIEGQDAAPIIKNNKFYKQSDTLNYVGGNALIIQNGAKPEITDNIFEENKRIGYMQPNVSLTLKNNTIVNNKLLDAIEVSYGSIYDEKTWDSDVPLKFTTNAGDNGVGNVYIRPSSTLNILPGTILKLWSGYYYPLSIAGTLNIFGEPNNKVSITSIRDDLIGGDTNRDGVTTTPRKSDWPALNVKNTGQIYIDYANLFYWDSDKFINPFHIDSGNPIIEIGENVNLEP